MSLLLTALAPNSCLRVPVVNVETTILELASFTNAHDSQHKTYNKAKVTVKVPDHGTSAVPDPGNDSQIGPGHRALEVATNVVARDNYVDPASPSNWDRQVYFHRSSYIHLEAATKQLGPIEPSLLETLFSTISDWHRASGRVIPS